MSVDLFAEWRAARAQGMLKFRPDQLGRFERWIIARGVDPCTLDRETYLTMYDELALEGRASRSFASTDAQIRRWYRWAALEALIPSIPFGDIPLGNTPAPPLPSVTEDEVFDIIRMGIRLGNDGNRSAIRRRLSARVALTVSLAYFMGVGPKDLSAMNVDVLEAICAGADLPELLSQAAACYAALLGPYAKARVHPLFVSERSELPEFLELSGVDLAGLSNVARVENSNPFSKPIVTIAAEMGLHNPNRFKIAEIHRLRKANQHKLGRLRLPGVDVVSRRTQYNRTLKTDWSTADMSAFAKLHPRYSAKR